MEKNKKVLFIGQPVGICDISGLPLTKIAQRENTIFLDEKIYLVGRVLGIDMNNVCTISDEHIKVLIITPTGFIISADKNYVKTEPSLKFKTFLQEQEYLLISQRYTPYSGRLEKVHDDEWSIPKFF
jgi:hypothetical protein